MSIGVALFIFVNALKNVKEVSDIFLEKAPRSVDILELKTHICEVEGVIDVHHIHVWSMDNHNHYATMHVVTNSASHTIKEKIREELQEHGIVHATLELEKEDEPCHEKTCRVHFSRPSGHHHH